MPAAVCNANNALGGDEIPEEEMRPGMEESAKDRLEKDYRDQRVEFNRDKRSHDWDQRRSQIFDIPDARESVEGADIQAEMIDSNIDESVKNVVPNGSVVITSKRMGPDSHHAFAVLNIAKKDGTIYLQVVDTLESPRASTTTASALSSSLSERKAVVITKREK